MTCEDFLHQRGGWFSVKLLGFTCFTYGWQFGDGIRATSGDGCRGDSGKVVLKYLKNVDLEKMCLKCNFTPTEVSGLSYQETVLFISYFGSGLDDLSVIAAVVVGSEYSGGVNCGDSIGDQSATGARDQTDLKEKIQ